MILVIVVGELRDRDHRARCSGFQGGTRLTGGGPAHRTPSAAADWASATTSSSTTLRALIRIPSVNPRRSPATASSGPPGGGRRPRRRRRPAEIHEPTAGRGSVTARLRGDGTGGEPLLLLSHLDVVPGPAGAAGPTTRSAADVADGYVWGRGAVDMKGMVAMEVAVIRRLAAEARAAGRDPATDPIPGLRRDVLFAVDRRRGGRWRRTARAGSSTTDPSCSGPSGALNECGGVSVAFGGRRFYPIGVAEKGYVDFRIAVHGTLGPRLDAPAGQRRGPRGRRRRPASPSRARPG